MGNFNLPGPALALGWAVRSNEVSCEEAAQATLRWSKDRGRSHRVQSILLRAECPGGAGLPWRLAE